MTEKESPPPHPLGWLEIESLDIEAQGVARRADGKVVFIDGALPGELVTAKVHRKKNNWEQASLVDREAGGKSQECNVIQSFFNMIERHTPQLVTWNGGGFDLPVLHYRGLRHGVVASKYWDLGDDDREFKFNNYIGRYHLRHLDLMDLLSMYQPRGAAPLDAMAKLCGFPGKLGMDGSQVFQAYQEGKLEDIRRYCETDVMNTYLLYCRYQKMRCGFTEAEYEQEIGFVKQSLADLAHGETHWQEYLAAWS